MAIAASPNSTALPSTDLSGLVSAIQQAVAQINSLLPALQAQLGTGAAAGASTLAGGPGQAPNQLPGQSPAQAPGSGCGCGGGAGGAMGAANVGKAPTGTAGTPPSGGMLDKLTKSAGIKQGGTSGGGGANAAPEPHQAAKADQAAPAAGSSKGQQMVEEIKKYLGTPYVFGGASPKGFDCSGLLLYVAKKFGIDLPHKASEQAKLGTAVDKANLQPGDMVFFKTDGSGGVSHSGMYIGNGQMIHAPKTGDVVKVSSINDSYYTKAWAGARRMG